MQSVEDLRTNMKIVMMMKMSPKMMMSPMMMGMMMVIWKHLLNPVHPGHKGG